MEKSWNETSPPEKLAMWVGCTAFCAICWLGVIWTAKQVF